MVGFYTIMATIQWLGVRTIINPRSIRMMMMVFNMQRSNMTIHVKIHTLHPLRTITKVSKKIAGGTISGISYSTPPDPLT